MNATLQSEGYVTPTPIQEKTLELILNRWDILGIAQTGTGKTAAFAVPIIEQGQCWTNQKTQTLVLCPTRELALQTTEVFPRTVDKPKDSNRQRIWRTVNCHTGSCSVRAGAQIVVGTPGRVKDLIQRNVLKLQNVRTVVLDEADEMLNFGFLPDIKAILSYVTGAHQTLLFAATMNKAVSGVVREFQHDAVRIELGHCNEPNHNCAAVVSEHGHADEIQRDSKPD